LESRCEGRNDCERNRADVLNPIEPAALRGKLDAMERDTHKYATWLADNARAGVVIEQKILEWKLAEQKLRGATPESSVPAAKAG
jgi:hypothetical protein